MASQLTPLTVALVAAISTDTALGSLLAGDKVYNTIAPTGSPFPYITLGLTQETANSVFSARGSEAGQVLDVWTRQISTDGLTRTMGNTLGLQIYDALDSLLHEKPLAVTGWRYCVGTLTLLATMPDPDGETFHLIARYDVIQRVIA